MKNDFNLNNENCTGCGACMNVCPNDAIRMQNDPEGFMYPVIEGEKCINCGQCITACPAKDNELEERQKVKCYGYRSSLINQLESSSGGAFGDIAECIIEQGGYIVGAYYDNLQHSVYHVMTDSLVQISNVKKSKYIQSEIGYVFRQIKKKLEKAIVLFAGCPCQVDGLYHYLGEKPENLYTIDLLCHGVASKKMWHKYLNEIGELTSITNVNFRGKQQLIKEKNCNFSCKIDKKDFFCLQDDFEFYKSYISNCISRKSCARCLYPYYKRVGDISLGDFSNGELIDHDAYDKYGTSLVLINTDKGLKLWELVKPKGDWVREYTYDAVISTGNQALFNNFKSSINREKFWDDSASSLLRVVNDRYNDEVFDYGILGLWYGRNYGAVLTSYALYKYIEKLGYKPILIDLPVYIFCDKDYGNNVSWDRQFVYRNCRTSKRYCSEIEMYDVNRCCKAYIIGSDSMWYSTRDTRVQEIKYRTCGFADSSKKIFTYATSFGNGYQEMLYGLESIWHKYLKRIDRISVREDTAVDYLKSRFGIESVQVLDPVFLLNSSEYKNMADKICDGNFIFAYLLNLDKEKKDIIRKLSQIGKKIILLSDSVDEDSVFDADSNISIVCDVSVEKWLAYMNSASYIITNSYHGVCFSIIFEKKFVCIRPRDAFARFESLNRIIEMDKHFVFNNDFDLIVEGMLESINYEVIRKKLLPWKRKSEEYLGERLGNFNTSCKNNQLHRVSDYEMEISDIWSKIYSLVEKTESLNSLQIGLINALNKQKNELIQIRISVICRILNSKLTKKRVAIKGAGVHTKELMKYLQRVDGIKIVCIISNDDEKNKFGFSVINNSSINEIDIDYVIISSFRYREEMKADLRSAGYRGEMIDIYQEMEQIGIFTDREFYR